MIRVIDEFNGGKIYTVERQCKNYGEIKQHLEVEGVETQNIQLCSAKLDAPDPIRYQDEEEIDWSEQDVIELYAYEREYPIQVLSAQDLGAAIVDQKETFHVVKGTLIAEIRRMFENKFGQGSLPEIYFGRDRLPDEQDLEGIAGQHFLLEVPILVGNLTIDVADEKCNQIRHLAVSPQTTAGTIWKQFMKNASPPRVMHTREGKGKPVHLCRDENCEGSHCPHTWLSYGGHLLEAEQPLWRALDLGEGENYKLVYYNPPPFSVTIKEKNEKNEIIETKIEIEDSNTIAEVRNKYSRNAEEGLVDGDLLLLDDQELKEERLVYSYGIRRDSALFVQKRSANQPMFTYICADCGNDLRLRKDEKIRCRECGHRVVYKPRLNKPLQHFAR